MEKKIRFIMPSHALTYNDLKKAGYEVCQNYYGNKMPFRLFREAQFRLNLPFKSIWYNRENRNFNGIIILYEGLVIPDYVNWLHKNNPEARLIMHYENLSNKYNRPDKINREYCELWTADKDEAVKYNMKITPVAGYFRHWKVEKTEPEFDVFYIGKDKGRMEELNALKSKLDEQGVTSLFYVTPEHSYEKCDKDHRPFIPYAEVLKYLGKTKAILHLSRGCQKGITMRIMESLIHRIKLITDDKDIVNYDFYDPGNIFIIDVDDWKKLPEFIDSPYVEKAAKFLENAYFEDGIDRLLKENDLKAEADG